MPRPPEPEKTRDIARRAVEILRAEGMGISMTRLARALEMRRPTLLYHFANAGEVVLSALEDMLMAQARFVLARIDAHDHPLDRLFARLTAIQAFHTGESGDHDDVGRVVFLTQAVATLGDAQVKRMMALANEVFEVHRQAQKRAITQGIRDGLVRHCDVDALSTLVSAMNDGLLIQRVMTSVAAGPVLDLIWNHLFAPLRLPPSPKNRDCQ